MRLTNVLNRCAAAIRAAARRVGQSLGLLGRTVIQTVARAIVPTTSAVRARLGRLAQVAIPVVAMACGRHEAPPPAPPVDLATTLVAAAAAPGPTLAAAPAIPVDAAVDAAPERPIGDFLMTFYYIAVEEEPAPRPATIPLATSPTLLAEVVPTASHDRADVEPVALAAVANDNDNDNADVAVEPSPTAAANDEAAVPSDDVALTSVGPAREIMFGRDCQPLAEVTPRFAAAVRMQGTGRLRDGRLINVAGACGCSGQCFHILRPGIKWGTGSSGLPLAPFRMVAVDPTLIPMGSLLYLPELDGMRMPGRAPAGGFIHDGCVVAADVGGAIKGRQLDLFVARRAYYEGLARRGSSHGWATSVEVWDGSTRCKRKGSRVSRSAAASI